MALAIPTRHARHQLQSSEVVGGQRVGPVVSVTQPASNAAAAQAAIMDVILRPFTG